MPSLRLLSLALTVLFAGPSLRAQMDPMDFYGGPKETRDWHRQSEQDERDEATLAQERAQEQAEAIEEGTEALLEGQEALAEIDAQLQDPGLSHREKLDLRAERRGIEMELEEVRRELSGLPTPASPTPAPAPPTRSRGGFLDGLVGIGSRVAGAVVEPFVKQESEKFQQRFREVWEQSAHAFLRLPLPESQADWAERELLAGLLRESYMTFFPPRLDEVLVFEAWSHTERTRFQMSIGGYPKAALEIFLPWAEETKDFLTKREPLSELPLPSLDKLPPLCELAAKFPRDSIRARGVQAGVLRWLHHLGILQATILKGQDDFVDDVRGLGNPDFLGMVSLRQESFPSESLRTLDLESYYRLLRENLQLSGGVRTARPKTLGELAKWMEESGRGQAADPERVRSDLLWMLRVRTSERFSASQEQLRHLVSLGAHHDVHGRDLDRLSSGASPLKDVLFWVARQGKGLYDFPMQSFRDQAKKLGRVDGVQARALAQEEAARDKARRAELERERAQEERARREKLAREAKQREAEAKEERAREEARQREAEREREALAARALQKKERELAALREQEADRARRQEEEAAAARLRAKKVEEAQRARELQERSQARKDLARERLETASETPPNPPPAPTRLPPREDSAGPPPRLATPPASPGASTSPAQKVLQKIQSRREERRDWTTLPPSLPPQEPPTAEAPSQQGHGKHPVVDFFEEHWYGILAGLLAAGVMHLRKKEPPPEASTATALPATKDSATLVPGGALPPAPDSVGTPPTLPPTGIPATQAASLPPDPGVLAKPSKSQPTVASLAGGEGAPARHPTVAASPSQPPKSQPTIAAVPASQPTLAAGPLGEPSSETVAGLAPAGARTVAAPSQPGETQAATFAPLSADVMASAASAGGATLPPTPGLTPSVATDPNLSNPAFLDSPAQPKAKQELPTWLRASLEAALSGRYQDLSVLGSGGMGTVVKATDTRLGREVAIKVPPPHLATHQEFRARFLREAQALARLSHPSITVVHDIPEVPEGEVPVMIMEYLNGKDLHHCLQNHHPLPIPHVLAWMIQAADAMAHAHQQGILHRDLKPANLLLIPEKNRVKILDFGLASLEDGPGLTRTGMLMGSLPYMPPEQMRGEKVDERADVFAFGATLFQLLTGVAPFEDRDPERRSHPPAGKFRPDLPAGLEELLGKTLLPDREARIAHMAEISTGLRAAFRSAKAKATAQTQVST